MAKEKVSRSFVPRKKKYLSEEDYVRLSSQKTKKSPREEIYERLIKTRAKEKDAQPRTRESATRFGLEESRRKLTQEKLKESFERGRLRDIEREVAFRSKTPFQRSFSSQRRSVGERNFSTKVRKLINVLAPKESLAKSLTYGGGVSRGRGRPLKTYKARYVPGVGFVRVPTAVYNKMISEAKTRQRLAMAQQQAMAEQVAMSQDPRYQQDFSEDQFLEGQDFGQAGQTGQKQQVYQQDQFPVEQPSEFPQQMPVQQQRQPNLIQRFISQLNRPRTPLTQRNPFFNAPQQQIGFSPQFGYQQRFQQSALKSEPQVTAITSQANILNTPNQFDRPGSGKILFKNPFYQDY